MSIYLRWAWVNAHLSAAPCPLMSLRPQVPAQARFVRVETDSSPSWVGWYETQVYGN